MSKQLKLHVQTFKGIWGKWFISGFTTALFYISCKYQIIIRTAVHTSDIVQMAKFVQEQSQCATAKQT